MPTLLHSKSSHFGESRGGGKMNNPLIYPIKAVNQNQLQQCFNPNSCADKGPIVLAAGALALDHGCCLKLVIRKKKKKTE